MSSSSFELIIPPQTQCGGLGYPAGCWECGAVLVRRETPAAEKAAFGAACKTIADQLIVCGKHKTQDSAWNEAKAWMRALKTGEETESEYKALALEASKWCEEHDPDEVPMLRIQEDDPEEYARIILEE